MHITGKGILTTLSMSTKRSNKQRMRFSIGLPSFTLPIQPATGGATIPTCSASVFIHVHFSPTSSTYAWQSSQPKEAAQKQPNMSVKGKPVSLLATMRRTTTSSSGVEQVSNLNVVWYLPFRWGGSPTNNIGHGVGSDIIQRPEEMVGSRDCRSSYLHLRYLTTKENPLKCFIIFFLVRGL